MDVFKDYVKDWCKEVSQREENVFVTKLRIEGFNYIRIAQILQVIKGVCNDCWDTEGRCYCTRDD